MDYDFEGPGAAVRAGAASLISRFNWPSEEEFAAQQAVDFARAREEQRLAEVKNPDPRVRYWKREIEMGRPVPSGTLEFIEYHEAAWEGGERWAAWCDAHSN